MAPATTRQSDSQRVTQWLEVLTRHAQSGLSVRAFCLREGLSKWKFYFWRRKLRGRDDPALSLSKEPAFVPVVVGPPLAACDTITIELRGGRMLRLPAALPASQLAAVIRVIESIGDAA